MSVDDDAPEGLALIAYEKLIDHGFALPCFGRPEGANTVYVARASRPGDPAARIAGFDIYDADDRLALPPGKAARQAKVGDPWLDVFLWAGEIHVGTKSEIWSSIEPVRSDIAALAPLSLLNLAEGVAGVETSELAKAAYLWLEQCRNASTALAWQIDTYLRGLAVRDLRRCRGEAAQTASMRMGLRNIRLVLKDKTLTLHLPSELTQRGPVAASDLYDYINAARAFGFEVVISRDGIAVAAGIKGSATTGKTLLMRLRKGRGATQTQIPFRVLASFFGDEIRVHSASAGTARDMTLSRTGDRRNTMKLQLPEMAQMQEPLARFIRTEDGITYELYDAESAEGKKIKELLDAGLVDGTTHQTQGAATWWRIL